MSNFHYTDDTATIERLSEQRDAIYEGVVDQFRVLMALTTSTAHWRLLMSSPSGWILINWRANLLST